ncbi:hypothetical protein OIU85_015858 [Salix viminalis]|uniref:Uncharacterized protein n=1 Tax=Salix viminalis TaxID=40686 RepID=A0A9Q0ZPC6_SALVM|nr:hypothetical protein OIU85_015858 [Salix viminalis]
MEDNKLEIVISSCSVSHSSTSCDEWTRKMRTEMKRETGGNYQHQGLKVPRVPSTFRRNEKNKNCYDPSVVSLGPYHHGKQALMEMEEFIKFPMACQFVRDCGISFEEMLSKVKELNIDASKCYEEDIIAKFNKDQFAQMMFLDGCFILQFLICFMQKPENLKMNSHDAGLITKDLFLLENQLPFSVLKSLMSLRYKTSDRGGGERMKLFVDFCQHIRAIPPRRDSCRDKISKYFGKLVSKSLSSASGLSVGDQGEPAHLLEFFHMQFVEHQASPRDHTSQTSRQEDDSRMNPIDKHSSIYRYHPAMELRRVGIHFKPSKTNLFTDVQFKPSLPTGQLKIPPLLINDSTESLLLNLVAYEACASKEVVTSYICFMDSLIDHAEDVRLLRSKGILINKFGSDQQVADLFNGIAKCLVPHPFVYASVKMKIESECNKVVNKWVAEWRRVYFRSPWTFIAVLAAIFTIALTAIQTYITAIQFFQPPKD